MFYKYKGKDYLLNLIDTPVGDQNTQAYNACLLVALYF